jgi:hypothetical protein
MTNVNNSGGFLRTITLDEGSGIMLRRNIAISDSLINYKINTYLRYACEFANISISYLYLSGESTVLILANLSSASPTCDALNFHIS